MNKPSKTLLMIRAYDQAVDFVAELNMQNPVIFSPMVSITPLNTDVSLPVPTTLIFTSSNAVRLYAAQTSERIQNTLCVGSVTAQAATGYGFTVSHSFETASDLVTYLQQTTKATKDIFYPRAETVSVDIAAALSGEGIPVSEKVLYRQSFQPLSDEAKHAIESLAVIAPILSKEVAFRFRDTLQSLKPEKLTIACISEAVAAVFGDLNGFNVEIASKPNRTALIQLINASLTV